MTTKKYNAVREAIIKACPEIMELSFGCRVIFERDVTDTEDGEDRYQKIKATIVESPNYKNVLLVWSNDNNFEPIYQDEIAEILGHPITLSHILRAIEKNVEYYNEDFRISADGTMFRRESTAMRVNEERYEGLVEKCIWNLSHDFEWNAQNVEGLLDFLYDILIKE